MTNIFHTSQFTRSLNEISFVKKEINKKREEINKRPFKDLQKKISYNSVKLGRYDGKRQRRGWCVRVWVDQREERV